MHLKSIDLLNYRNYTKLGLNFSPSLNIILGDNAQGKTNILEAIHLLSLGKSHRTHLSRELISWEATFSCIRGKAIRGGKETCVELMIGEDGLSRIKINGALKRRVGDLIGHINAVLFCPEDLKIVKEGPEGRRGFIDDVISQVHSQYYFWRQRYLRCLRQRNALLKQIAVQQREPSALDMWDKHLIETGTRIIIQRERIIRRLCKYSDEAYRRMTGGKGGDNLHLTYLCELIEDDPTPGKIESRFELELEGKRDLEIERGMTLVGPHRDDLLIQVNGVDMRTFGSQGEQRTSSLALRLGQWELIKEETKDFPVLLLDDALSELDEKRRTFLMEMIEEDAQTIITSTNPVYFAPQHLKDANLFRIEGGQVSHDV
ncbi:MAG: DNA replication/repair protein RecF [Actinomycetota bacterium]|nr:DNA replication/repair protein RecF [Actinomycetota bacterium]